MKAKEKKMDFEKSLQKLEKIVDQLEEGDLSLENSLNKYEEGVKLVKMCQEKLDKAKARIDLLAGDSKGGFVKKDFQTEKS